jgi:hypothetical protein
MARGKLGERFEDFVARKVGTAFEDATRLQSYHGDAFDWDWLTAKADGSVYLSSKAEMIGGFTLPPEVRSPPGVAELIALLRAGRRKMKDDTGKTIKPETYRNCEFTRDPERGSYLQAMRDGKPYGPRYYDPRLVDEPEPRARAGKAYLFGFDRAAELDPMTWSERVRFIEVGAPCGNSTARRAEGHLVEDGRLKPASGQR